MKRLPPLSPYRRDLLLDALRPPGGFRLDRAVGTCFSLDLMSALVVPLAFALFDLEASDESAADPTAVLAAAQTQAEKMTIYCEAGRIARCAQAPSALAYLEASVHTVHPPDRGAFHPKVWVLRFASDDGDVVHRCLCLSRNLTLDRSWDTILALQEGDAAPKQTEPLATFLENLNHASPSEHARELAGSIRRVGFAPPPGFDSMRFIQVGAFGNEDPVTRGNGQKDHLFVLSPFVDAGRIDELTDGWTRVDLAARGEALDRIPPETLNRVESLFVFDSMEQMTNEPDASSDEPSTLGLADERLGESHNLSGLHAKVHCSVRGDDAFLLVGSANATKAGFNRNVEFCVELRGSKGQVGPAALLREREDKSGLSVLLRPYTRREQATEPSAEELELERLEWIRRDWAALRLVAAVRRRTEEGPWDLALKAEKGVPKLLSGDALRCWPVTLSAGTAEKVGPGREVARFRFNSLANITRYFSFSLTTRMPGVPEVSFTLEAELEGDIEDRLDRVLGETLRDPEKFIRFLFLLLSAGDGDAPPITPGRVLPPGPHGHIVGDPPNLVTHVPLLEILVRTFARDPGRLDAFRTAIRHVKSAKQRGMEVPEGLLEIWDPVEKALTVAEKRKS